VSQDLASTPSSSGPLVSVIIVTYRSEGTITACLKSVLDSAEALEALVSAEDSGPALEVIVIDNGSGDGTIPRVLKFGKAVRLIPNPDNRGFARGVNQGIRVSSGKYVLLLNPDCRVEPGAIAELVRFMRANEVAGACGPKVRSPDGSIQLSCRAFPNHSTALFHRHSLLTRLFPKNPHSDRYLKTTWDHSAESQVDWVSGAAMLLRRKALKQIGSMDEDYFLYSEDVDLCWRLQEAGWATFYVPSAVIWHHVGRSSRQAPFRALYERHRSMYTFYKKHYSQDIPLIDFATFLGIAFRCLLYVTLAATGHSVGHHGERPLTRRRKKGGGTP
jgi:GT2 family glycosyltransferase